MDTSNFSKITDKLKRVMKFAVIIFFILITTNTFSQRTVLEMNVPELEKKAICKMRKIFKIHKDTVLFATIVLRPGNTDTVGTRYSGENFDIGQTIEKYLNGLEFYSSSYGYEIFVYDTKIKNVFVTHRSFILQKDT